MYSLQMSHVYINISLPSFVFMTNSTPRRALFVWKKRSSDKPESLCNRLISPFLQSFMLLVASVLILYDDGCISTLLEPFLSIVTTELTLYQHGSLSHLLIVRILEIHMSHTQLTTGNTHGTHSINYWKYTCHTLN